MSTVTINNVVYSLSGTTATVTGYSSPPSNWNLVIPSTVTNLGNTYNVTSIGNQAFLDAFTLTSVTIPSSITSIGDQAFLNVINLTSVNFSTPSFLESIGTSAFQTCTSLTSITIPNSIKNIGGNVFAGCSSLIVVNYNPTISDLPSDVTWYDFNIKLNSNNSIVLDGYFAVINSTNFIKLMYSKSNLTTNILAQYSNYPYGNSHLYNITNNNNFDYLGTNITSIPALDTIYNALEWSLYYDNGDSISYKDASNNWIDLPPNTVTYSFTPLASSPITPIVPICFPAGTPVVTDQGIIAIDKINPTKNTIRGKKIVAITKTVTIEDKIVCIEKDALASNIPSQKTFISRNHKLFYNKQMIKAKQLIGQVDGVYNKKYNGEILYNVLLETHEKMMVNNLIVETLNPTNIVAQLYNGSLTNEEKNNLILNINQCAKDYKSVYGKLK